MVQGGVGRLPVVSPDNPRRVVGIVTRSDLLKPRAREAEEEAKRERLLRLGWPFARRKRKSNRRRGSNPAIPRPNGDSVNPRA